MSSPESSSSSDMIDFDLEFSMDETPRFDPKLVREDADEPGMMFLELGYNAPVRVCNDVYERARKLVETMKSKMLKMIEYDPTKRLTSEEVERTNRRIKDLKLYYSEMRKEWWFDKLCKFEPITYRMVWKIELSLNIYYEKIGYM